MSAAVAGARVLRHACQTLAVVAVALPLVAAGCGDRPPGTPIPDLESRPEGHGRVVKAAPIDRGVRLTLDSGVVLEIGPQGTRMVQQTTTGPLGPDGLAVYGHDERGLWLLWLGLESRLGPDCFALPKLGYDRPGYIGWPDDHVALPKAAGFLAEGGVHLVRDPQSAMFGWYTTGGEGGGHATFCISPNAEVTSVWP